jgi:5'-nucleotidase
MSFHRSLCVLVAAGALTCGAALAQPAKAPVTVKLIGFNDYHGNFESPGTFDLNTTVPAA